MANLLGDRRRLCDEKWIRYTRNKIVRFILAHPLVTHSLNGQNVERLKWDEVERRMKKERPKNETELKQALLRVWQGIGQDVTKKLVNSVPNRLNEVIRMNGYPTRY